jgi:hypothetical protein
MTPKEKAQELVDKFDEILTYLESKQKAKQCALIAVDEIIKNQDNVVNILRYKLILGGIKSIEMPSDYWNKVKQEIQEL